MLQFFDELEHFMGAKENEGKNIINKCKNKARNLSLYKNFLNDIIESNVREKKEGFLELIENALDSMHFEGGDVTLNLSPNNKGFEFSISDMGHGMTTKDLISYLLIPFKSTRKEGYKSPFYGSKGTGFQTILNLSDNIRVITSSGDGIIELEIEESGDDRNYTLTTREGKVTGTTIIGNFSYDSKSIIQYLKKYFFFVNPDKYRITINGEKINTGKILYKGSTFKYAVQKNNIKNNMFLYTIKDGNNTFDIYRKGMYVKSYKENLKEYTLINSFISALMEEADYSFIIEVPEIIELTGSKDDFFIDDKSNLENRIRKMLESYILSEVITSETIMNRIEHRLLFVYEILFKEIVEKDSNNNRNFQYFKNKEANFSTYFFRKLTGAKFINVLQVSSANSHSKRTKLSIDDFYKAINKRNIFYINRMDKNKTGTFIEENHPAMKGLMNIDSSYYNLIKTTQKDDYDNQAREKYRQERRGSGQKSYPKTALLERTHLNVLERILNIEKKAGDYVVLLRIFKALDDKLSNALNIPHSSITIHSNLTINNDEIALTNEKNISFNISNKYISQICDNLLKKNAKVNDFVKMIDILIHEKAHILSDNYSKSDVHPISFYELAKEQIKSKFFDYIKEHNIDLKSEFNKLMRARPYSERTKVKDMMRLTKKHTINNFNRRYNSF